MTSKLQFFETNHQYRKNGEGYQSVTGFLSKFKPPFPKGVLAEKIAKKEGKTPDDILSKWDLNAEISRDYGNSIHRGIEYWIKYGEIPKTPHIKSAVEKFAKKYNREKMKTEIMVDNDEYKLVGTIDQLHILGKKRIKITDVKTNRELTDKAYKKFLAPLNDLPLTKLNEYRLQLSTYKYLLELKGFTVESIDLEHWNGEDYKTINLEPIDIKQLLKT